MIFAGLAEPTLIAKSYWETPKRRACDAWSLRMAVVRNY